MATTKNIKPLIFIGAGITVAIIALAAQVVFLSFNAQDMKDSLRKVSGHNDLSAIHTKINGLQDNVLELSRDMESIRYTISRLDSEMTAMRSIVNKVGKDSQFLQQELTNFDNRISDLEKAANNTEYTLKNLERSIHY